MALPKERLKFDIIARPRATNVPGGSLAVNVLPVSGSTGPPYIKLFALQFYNFLCLNIVQILVIFSRLSASLCKQQL